jgi:hypothetical protein
METNFDSSSSSASSFSAEADQPLVTKSDSRKNSADNLLNTGLSINEETMIINESIEYKAIQYHWFYSHYVLDKKVWQAMSLKDSANLEQKYSENK